MDDSLLSIDLSYSANMGGVSRKMSGHFKSEPKNMARFTGLFPNISQLTWSNKYLV